MADCVFCKIIAGQVPAAMLLETDRAVSFLDINPVNPGHALIVPRRHVTSLLELNQDELHVAIYLAQRVAAAVTEQTGSPAFNLLQNNGRCAGQLIEHVHFHIIPRNPSDGFSFGWRHLQYGEGELQALQEAIRERL
jgi:histidine triad (HIT) family protein